MEETKLPIGFGMALAMNAEAMKSFAAMTEAKQDAVLEKARLVSSKGEMQQLVAGLAKESEAQEAQRWQNRG